MSITTEIKQIIKRDEQALEGLWKKGDLVDYARDRADEIIDGFGFAWDEMEETKNCVTCWILNELKEVNK
jgi:hypothetical protein